MIIFMIISNGLLSTYSAKWQIGTVIPQMPSRAVFRSHTDLVQGHSTGNSEQFHTRVPLQLRGDRAIPIPAVYSLYQDTVHLSYWNFSFSLIFCWMLPNRYCKCRIVSGLLCTEYRCEKITLFLHWGPIFPKYPHWIMNILEVLGEVYWKLPSCKFLKAEKRHWESTTICSATLS